jgi:hypothetical protein
MYTNKKNFLKLINMINFVTNEIIVIENIVYSNLVFMNSLNEKIKIQLKGQLYLTKKSFFIMETENSFDLFNKNGEQLKEFSKQIYNEVFETEEFYRDSENDRLEADDSFILVNKENDTFICDIRGNLYSIEEEF